MREHEWVVSNVKGSSLTLQRLEGGDNILRSPDSESIGFEAKLVSCCLKLIPGVMSTDMSFQSAKYEEEFPGTPYFATRPLHATPKALHTIILGIFDS